MAVHLAVACDIFDGVLFCAVLFSLRDVLTEILDRIDSVPENFPTYLLSIYLKTLRCNVARFRKFSHVFKIKVTKVLESLSSTHKSKTQ